MTERREVMTNGDYTPSRESFKIGHTIIGGILVVASILIDIFATGDPTQLTVAFLFSIALIGWGVIKIIIANSA